MHNAYDWEDDNKLKGFLASQLTHGRLALVLGAGISIPFGLPDWKGLIDSLYLECDETPEDGLNLERLAEHLRNKHFADDKEGFLNLVSTKLYNSFSPDFDILRQNKTLAAVGSLVMASFRGTVSSVITLNFDNILELYLTYHGFAVSSVGNQKFWNQSADVTIYHPHGYLPIPSTGRKSEDIVFDQESYSRVIGNPNSLWYQKVLTILRTHTCIFIGLSGNDNNLDSLLFASNDNHAIREGATLHWGVHFTTDRSEATCSSWRRRGVFSKIVDNYAEALPGFMFEICQKAARIRLQ